MPKDSSNLSSPKQPASTPILPVVLGLITHENGHVLMSQRRATCPFAGLWEFPGGKIEPQEAPLHALKRELQEELGIEVVKAKPLYQSCYDYRTYADNTNFVVELSLWQILNYLGEPQGREGQKVQWFDRESWRKLDLLPAGYPVMDYLNSITF